jgi:hypothetical protein
MLCPCFSRAAEYARKAAASDGTSPSRGASGSHDVTPAKVRGKYRRDRREPSLKEERSSETREAGEGKRSAKLQRASERSERGDGVRREGHRAK